MYYSLLNPGLLINAWPHTKKHCAWWKKKGCAKPWNKSPSHRPSILPTASHRPSILPTVSNEPSPLPSVIPTSSPSNEPSETASPSNKPSETASPSNKPSETASPSNEPTMCTAFSFSTSQQLRIAADEWVTDQNSAISTYGNIQCWNVERITSMEMLFCGSSYTCSDVRPHTANMKSFNADLSKWKVSRVTSMKYMFLVAKQFNSHLSGWDVGNVVTMENMFDSAEQFNSNVSGWNIGNMIDMKYMFYYAEHFNQNMCAWKETSADTIGMFVDTACDNDYQSNGKWCFSCDN